CAVVVTLRPPGVSWSRSRSRSDRREEWHAPRVLGPEGPQDEPGMRRGVPPGPVQNGAVGDQHDHNHAHPGALAEERRRVLWIVLIVNALYVVVEIAGGLIFDSLSLLADAAHMFSDVTGLGIALVAQALVLRPASPRHSYGLA